VVPHGAPRSLPPARAPLGCATPSFLPPIGQRLHEGVLPLHGLRDAVSMVVPTAPGLRGALLPTSTCCRLDVSGACIAPTVQVASCYRRIGAIPQALAKYKEIHGSHPDNIECLRYLVHLCTDLGRRDDAHEYLARLRRAERTQVGHHSRTFTHAAALPAGVCCASSTSGVRHHYASTVGA
jgi:hypothetical protein